MADRETIPFPGRALPAACAVLLTCLLLSYIASGVAASVGNTVLSIKVNGVINPVASEFIGREIDRAAALQASALVIELDTPGGFDSSMRTIVQKIIGSSVPVVVYVSPSGARAASAGVFIAMAAQVSAMAPGTNIGAAHPVSVGEKMDKTMAEKATNDAAAYIRSLADRTGRNGKWAEDAVRKSVSIPETEALKQRVVDIVSPDLVSLLKEIDGRRVRIASGEVALTTEGATIVRDEMGLRHRILGFISDPSVAYMLMLLGFYGIFFELTNPGSVLPGVTGAIFLILAFYAFQTLPVNYAGVLLIVLALVLFLLEVKIVSHGVLTVGGIVAMVFGSLMLFDAPMPFMRLSLYLILPAVIVTALFFTVTFGLALKASRRRPTTGSEGLVGLSGRAAADITPEGGMVTVRGERWSAVCDTNIPQGSEVIVVAVAGLRLTVRKKGDTP